MARFVFVLLFLMSANQIFAQNSNPTQFANYITETDLHRHLAVLTSDSLEGRETGTDGLMKASNYIIQQLNEMGAKPVGDNGFFQIIEFVKQEWDTIRLKSDNSSFRHLMEYYAIPGNNPKVTISTEEIYFGGYGIDNEVYSDYKKHDFSGKVLLVFADEPRLDDTLFLFSGNNKPAPFSSIDAKLIAAASHGVKALLIIDPNFLVNTNELRKTIFSNRLSLPSDEFKTTNILPHLFLSTESVKKLVGNHLDSIIARREMIQQERKYNDYQMPMNLFIKMVPKVTRTIAGNVVGMIEGSDKNLKSEIVVASAHYDHLGKRGDSDIFHGADDDGSGSVSVLEIMESMSKAKKAGVGPKRSVVGIWFCGEEKGLLGSRYYVNHPLVSLEKTIADVNIDMVGRIDSQHLDKKEYVYSIGSGKISKDLYDLNEAVNTKYSNLTLDYTYDDEKDPNRFYYRSDHYNFAEKGIPIVFFFNGVHPDYHRVTDTIEKIDFPVLTKRAKHAFYLIWEIANKLERLK